MRILVCVSGYQRIMERLEQALPADDIVACPRHAVVENAAHTDVLIPIIADIPAAAFAQPRVRLVQQYGAGLDSVDIPAATAAGVLVANVPSAGSGNAESVAELAIAHMLMLSRDVPGALASFRERRFGVPLGRALWESTVTIVGYGGIGQEIARRLAGFGVRIVAVSRHGPHGARERDPGVAVDVHVGADQLHDAVAQADFVIVAAPAGEGSVGLIDGGVFAAMKPGSFIVNIARGPVIDYDALLAALRERRIAGAGLDVFWDEPFDPDDPLLRENVIATPHVGGVTGRSLDGIARAVAANVDRLRRGECPLHCVNHTGDDRDFRALRR